MGIERLLKKFDKVKKAVNSIKGIQSKIQSINYTTALDSLGQSQKLAEDILSTRRQNLSKDIAQKQTEKTRTITQNRKSFPRRPWTSQEQPKDPQGTPQQRKGRPKTPKSHPKEPQMTPKGLQGMPLGSTKASKRHKKAPKTTPERNQNSEWKIDATVIATATPPTQLSNNTASTTISALRNARSA